MAGRQSLVHNNNNTGRKALADRMEEEVSEKYEIIICMLCVLHNFTTTSVRTRKFVLCMRCVA